MMLPAVLRIVVRKFLLNYPGGVFLDETMRKIVKIARRPCTHTDNINRLPYMPPGIGRYILGPFNQVDCIGAAMSVFAVSKRSEGTKGGSQSLC